MATLTIRRPTATFDAPAAESFRVGRPLRGLRVGVRQDGTWRSWQVIVAVWLERLRGDGAEPVLLQTGERTGAEGERTRAELAVWIDAVDCAVVGLGTCGSCTMWSVRDAIGVERAHKPVVVGVCEEFVAHARTTAEFLGHHGLKVLVLPYPLEARPEAELRAIADAWYPKMLDLLGVTRDG
ncbi:MAG: hypothetical protein KIT14_00685 [bacterium]|nr:hypothetical protein [bacterium]